MANELGISLNTTGLTVKAIIWDVDRAKRWNGSAFVLPSTIADAAWETGMIACTEQSTSTPSSTGRYVGTFPTAVTTQGEYEAVYYSDTGTIAPGDNALGNQPIHWAGAAGGNPAIEGSEGALTALRSTLTEAYATDGSAPTTEQVLFMIWSFLAERSVASTTVTAKKLDGSTTAMTFTLDSATTPTSITRAT